MLKIITDKKDYSFLPMLESSPKLYNTPVMLFGKEWRIMDDFWMKHIHIKITDRCDAHCPFCIEKHSHIRENRLHLLENIKHLIPQMDGQGHLATVSITGGEPSLCEYTGDVIDYLKQFNVFLNINTNLHRIICSKADPDWLNVSRHIVGSDYYTGIHALDISLLSTYKEMHPKTKVRLQCVLHPQGLKTIEEILAFIESYRGYIDDLSFRRLINTTDDAPNDDLFQQLKHYLYDNAYLVEQVLKDYYVYETWNLDGLDITLSHSNMKLLKDLEGWEDDRIIREIVVHPDGLISGSWYRNRKIIKE